MAFSLVLLFENPRRLKQTGPNLFYEVRPGGCYCWLYFATTPSEALQDRIRNATTNQR